jgi:hypothetical protein
MRILSIGSELKHANSHADWTESPNVKDFDLVLMDIEGLDRLYREGDETYLSNYFPEDTVNLPAPPEVSKALRSGTDFLATLPYKGGAQNYIGSVGGIARISYFSFVPTELGYTFENGVSVNADSILPEWEWYFPATDFKWHVHFDTGTFVPGGDRISEAQYRPILTNGYDQALAIRCDYIMESGSDETGSIYLIPKIEGWKFSSLTYEFLRRIILDEDSDKKEHIPEWTTEYTVPGEEKVIGKIEDKKSRIEELKKQIGKKEGQLEELQQFKGLLYAGDDFLEQLVPEVFDEMGFDVEGEKPHHRDALIRLPDKHIVLEIHGTSGGIARKKCRQLEEWVGDLEMENPDQEYMGMLVVNPMMDKPPTERNGYMTPDIEKYLEKRSHKLLPTPELFKVYTTFLRGKISKGDLERKLRSDETVLRFDELSF